MWWGVHRQCVPERVALQRCRSSNSRSPFIYISCNHNPVNLGNMQAMLNWAIQNGSHGSAPTPEGAAVNEDDPEFEEKRKHLMAVSVRYVTSLFLSKLSQFLSLFFNLAVPASLSSRRFRQHCTPRRCDDCRADVHAVTTSLHSASTRTSMKKIMLTHDFCFFLMPGRHWNPSQLTLLRLYTKLFKYFSSQTTRTVWRIRRSKRWKSSST